MKSSILRMVAVAGFALALSACGKSPSSIFKNAVFSTYQQNGDQYVQLETDINSSNVIFTGVTLPITHNGTTIGTVSVSTNLSTGLSSMIVSLDLTKVLKVPTPTMSGNLPNGLPWPVTGVDLTKMMAFNVGNSGSVAYLYYDSAAKKVLLGAALNISGLSSGTPAAILSPFSANKINGVVGLYVGSAKNTSGVAFLADVSSTLGLPANSVKFFSSNADKKTNDQVDRQIYRMNQRHAHIVLK